MFDKIMSACIILFFLLKNIEYNSFIFVEKIPVNFRVFLICLLKTINMFCPTVFPLLCLRFALWWVDLNYFAALMYKKKVTTKAVFFFSGFLIMSSTVLAR